MQRVWKYVCVANSAHDGTAGQERVDGYRAKPHHTVCCLTRPEEGGSKRASTRVQQ